MNFQNQYIQIHVHIDIYREQFGKKGLMITL